MQALLSTLPLFEALNEKSVGRLSRGARQIHAPKGTLLFSPGDTPEGLYIVVSGLVKIAVPTAAEQEKVVTLLGSGKSFGLSALFADEPPRAIGRRPILPGPQPANGAGQAPAQPS